MTETWIGTFQSDSYTILSFWEFTLVKGQIALKLDQDGKAGTCSIKYTGFYRKDQEITGKIRTLSNGEMEGDIGGMVITLTDLQHGVGTFEGRYIQGKYKIQTPADRGSFKVSWISCKEEEED